MLSNLEETIPHQVDLILFEKLGLKPFKTSSRDRFLVGEYKLPHSEKATIKISVTCLPAKFWCFEVITVQDEAFIIETGSGTLSEFWDSVIKVAEGLFTVSRK